MLLSVKKVAAQNDKEILAMREEQKAQQQLEAEGNAAPAIEE